MAGDMIRVQCECGKAARVPTRYAGRQVKCSGCGGKLTIPEEGGSSEPGPTGASPAGASGPAGAEGYGAPVGGAVGGPVGSQIGRDDAPEVEVYRRPGAGGGGRPQSDSYARGGGDSRERPARDRGGVPDYGLPSKRQRSASSAANDPYAPPRADVDEYQPRGHGGSQSRDLGAEAHIVAIGIWKRISGVLAIAGCGLMVLVTGVGAVAGSGMGKVESFLVVLGCLVGLALSIGYYYVGVSLIAYRGWARIVAAVLFGLEMLARGVLLLLGDPSQLCAGVFGLAWGGAQMWALFSQRANRVFSPRYAQAVRGDPRKVPWAKSPFFWLPLAFILLIVGLFVFAMIAMILSR